MTFRRSLAILCAIVVGGAAEAQFVNFTGASYTQNFNTLALSGNGNAWSNGSTLQGWYLRRMDDASGGTQLSNVYNASTGSSNSGAVYSFGASSNSERALGSVSSGGQEHAAYGVWLRNSSGQTMRQVTVTYTGEQWRDGGLATGTTGVAAQRLRFSYDVAVGGTGDIGVDTQTATGVAGYGADPRYTNVTSLDFVSPTFVNTTSSGNPLDGNSAANRQLISYTIDLVDAWDNGEDLWLRWVDLNDANNDHGLGVDDLTVSASPVPEPASMAALGLGVAALIRRRQK